MDLTLPIAISIILTALIVLRTEKKTVKMKTIKFEAAENESDNH